MWQMKYGRKGLCIALFYTSQLSSVSSREARFRAIIDVLFYRAMHVYRMVQKNEATLHFPKYLENY